MNVFFFEVTQLTQKKYAIFALKKHTNKLNKMKMKKQLIAALTIIVMAMLSEAFAVSSTNDIGNIPLYPEPIPEGSGNRNPISVPIECFFFNGELTFTFSADLGTVECEVVRLSDEATFDAIFYAVNGGSDSLYVSTDADDYVITLTCADGTKYYGKYTLE